MCDDEENGFDFNYHATLEGNSNFKLLYDEFQDYKLDSADDEYAAPKEKVQKKKPSINSLFGRDRIEQYNRKGIDQDIHHLHINDDTKEKEWVLKNGQRREQWYCTSNTYMVYAYFLHKKIHYYYILDFLVGNAHINYPNRLYQSTLINAAEAYKNEIIDNE